MLFLKYVWPTVWLNFVFMHHDMILVYVFLYSILHITFLWQDLHPTQVCMYTYVLLLHWRPFVYCHTKSQKLYRNEQNCCFHSFYFEIFFFMKESKLFHLIRFWCYFYFTTYSDINFKEKYGSHIIQLCPRV